MRHASLVYERHADHNYDINWMKRFPVVSRDNDEHIDNDGEIISTSCNAFDYDKDNNIFVK